MLSIWYEANAWPAFVRVDTYRLAAHSKGDDDRAQDELATFAQRDPVNHFLARANGDGELVRIRERVTQAVVRAEAQEELALSSGNSEVRPRAKLRTSIMSAEASWKRSIGL